MRTVGLVERPAVVVAPVAGLKKADITARLDALGVDYNPKAKKDTLLELLKAAEADAEPAEAEEDAEAAAGEDADIEPDAE